MKKIVFGLLMIASLAYAQVSDQEIANMFMLGFEGKSVEGDSTIMRDICESGLGGVILFKKNIGTKSQLKRLTSSLSSCNHQPLIATDQEGGTVRRIRYGWEYPRASSVAKKGTRYAKGVYDSMGAELHSLGINYNLAPVADLDIEPKNYIIHKLGRSYGANPADVKSFNTAFIKAMHRHGVLTALKHFPGHGSSLGDTHRGFVDVSGTWNSNELKPFWNTKADSVMIAHVVNDQIADKGLPASLSPKAIRELRRRNKNVVAITDDLQMGAIRKYYTNKQIIQMSINAGEDILLFGNQLSKSRKVNTRQLISIIRELLSEGRVKEGSIRSANRRINRMKRKIGLRDKKTKHLHRKLRKKRHKTKSSHPKDLF